MRIGVDCRPLMERDRTGVGEYTYQLTQALLSLPEAHEYIFFYSGVKSTVPSSSVHLKIPNKLLSACTFFFGRPYLDKVIEHKKGKIDIFFSPNLNFTALSPTCRFVLTIHDLSFELHPKWYTRKQRIWHRAVRPRKQCQRADVIVVPSENTKCDVVDVYRIAPEKIHVIYPGIFGSDIFEKPKKTAEEVKKHYQLPDRFFLYLGTVEPRKNVDGIIKAFDLFQKKYPDAKRHLVIAGAWGWGSMGVKELIDRTPHVHYIGYVAAEDKPVLYQCADAFLYPSFYEGFGLPVVEAMSYGAPVIASNRSSLPEVTQGKALLVNPYDVGEVADALTFILQNPVGARAIADEAKQVVQQYQWKKTAQEFLSVISL